MDSLGTKAQKINSALQQSLKLAELGHGGDDQCRCGIRVSYGPDGTDEEEYANRVEPPPLPPCDKCGGWQTMLRVVYESPATDAMK